MSVTITVEMGQIAVSRSPAERLAAVGLGASVGLCLYDPQALMGGLAHIVLPQSPDDAPAVGGERPLVMPARYADAAVAHLIAEMDAHGAEPRRLRAALAGGARIFSHSTGASGPQASPVLSRLEIGARNIVAVRAALEAAAIPLLAWETGECCGRTITFCIETGDVSVRRIGGAEARLAALGRPLGCVERERHAAHGH